MTGPSVGRRWDRRASLFAFLAITVVYLAHVSHYLASIGPYLVDDAFIYFRYADNLANGHGLVYNVGDPVEGYTGFTWVLLLALAIGLGLPPIGFAQAAGVLLGLLTLWLTWRIAERLVAPGPWALLPSLWLATSRTFCVWAVEGLETKLFGALLLTCLWIWLTDAARAEPRRLPSLGLAAAALTLTRPEGLAFAGLAGLSVVLGRGGRAVRPLLGEALAFVAVVGGHLVFRLSYYGDVLPNTFYAKVVGVQASTGLEFLTAFGSTNWVALYLVATVAGAVRFAAAKDHLGPRRWTLLAVAFHVVYLIVIGGDYFEFRFLDPLLPIWALWTAVGARWLAQQVTEVRFSRATALALVALALLANSLAFLRPPEASLKRATPEGEAAYTRLFVETGRWLAKNLEPEDLVAIQPAGAIAYLSRARCLDLLGLNDRDIARGSELDFEATIGHQRVVSEDYLRQRGVTYVIAHPTVTETPFPPGRGLISAELSPGRFLLMKRLDPNAALEDRIYRLGEHRGSLSGWRPAGE